MTKERKPLWAQLARALRSDIKSGDLPPGALLPGERELIDIHGVSRTTVRHALTALADESLIVSLPRRGWRVQQPGQ